MDNNLQDILKWMSEGKEMVLTRESVFIKEMKDVNARKVKLEKVLQDGKKKLKFLKDDSSMLANLAKEKDTVIRKLQQALASLPKDLRDEVETMSRSNISGDGDACSMKRKSGELVREEARIMQTPNRKVPQRGAFQLSYESYSMKRKMKEPNAICSVTDKKSPFSSANNKVPRGFQHQPPPTPKSFKFGNKFSSIEELGSRPSPAESKGATSDSEHTEASMRTSFIHNSGNKKQAFLPRKSSVCSWQPQVSSTLRDRSQDLDSGCVAHQTTAPTSMNNFTSLAKSGTSKPKSQASPPDFWKSTPGRIAREALTRVQPAQLVLVEDVHKVRGVLRATQEQKSVEEKERRMERKEEKENRMGKKEEQGAMLNSKETTMRRSSAPLKDEPPRFQFQESDTSQLQSSWPRACAANRVTEEAELDVAGRFRNEADAPLKGRSYQGDTPRKHFTAEPHVAIQNGLVIKSILKKRC